MASDVRLIRSPVSVLGMVLTTTSAVLFLIVFLADVFGLHTNPYIGILFFLILPAVFVAGLVLIPLGAWLERRRRAGGKTPSPSVWPRVDLNDPNQRLVAIMIFALTMANIVIVSLASYRGVEYMDSVQFCGQACHTAMKPQFVAHTDGPHSHVQCVACHVGPGASSFAKAKLAGTRRVLAVAHHSYQRPIVAAPDQLLSATDTCLQCHNPARIHGDTIKRIVEYADDKTNTQSVTTLRLHVGGAVPGGRGSNGIHWHAGDANDIEYSATDQARQVIPYVRARGRDGVVREYVVAGAVAPEAAARRRMDCTDCHNRPSHRIAPSAERAVNEAMAAGLIPNTLPFIHREAVKVLKTEYPSEEAAAAAISRTLSEFYRTARSQSSITQTDLEQAIRAARDVYRRNVFPDMRVRFGTYANNIGHVDSPGCFRCHDDEHKSKDGRTISQDCELCHSIE